MVPVPVRSEDVTPEWLTAFLSPRNPDVLVDDLEVLEYTQGAATRLRSQLKEVRAAHEGLISPLHAYLIGAFGSFDSDRDVLAVALLAGAPQGPHLARQWLDDPALCHDAAVAAMTAMRARASAYLESARKPASGSEPQRVA
jgi:hypothetical protein